SKNRNAETRRRLQLRKVEGSSLGVNKTGVSEKRQQKRKERKEWLSQVESSHNVVDDPSARFGQFFSTIIVGKSPHAVFISVPAKITAARSASPRNDH